MKISNILAELGNDTRLAVFQTLVRFGSGGMTVGQLQSVLNVPPSTLAFHLKGLASVGLVSQERDGRTVICRARLDVLNNAIATIQDQCCRAKTDDCGCSPKEEPGRPPQLEIAI
jgi:ArsR family transcriptional regulator, arsenate/arsenite/antimonite-responsive transcriptional repressor